MRKILTLYAAVMLLFSIPALAVRPHQQVPSADFMPELYRLQHLETQRRLNELQNRLERHEELTEQLIEAFHNHEDMKHENALRQIEERNSRLEAKISQSMSTINTWGLIFGLVIGALTLLAALLAAIIALFGWLGWKKADTLFEQHSKMIGESRSLLEAQKQITEKSRALHSNLEVRIKESQGNSATFEKSGKPQPVIFSDNTLDQARQILGADAQEKEASYKNSILWSKAVLAHDDGNWTDALPLWKVILQDESDNPSALFSAGTAAHFLAHEKPEGTEREALLDAAITYYDKLFKMPLANVELRTRASVNLIAAHSDAGNLDAAQKILDAMLDLGDSEFVKEAYAFAADCIKDLEEKDSPES